MPRSEQSTTFLPPLPPSSPCIPSSTHPSQSVAFLVAGKQRKPTNAKSGRPPPGPHSIDTRKKKVLYVEPLQNATSRKILATYFQRQPDVPVDWRNGLDMRTLAPAQDPNYLTPQQTTTYETNMKSARPYYEGGLLNQLRHGYGKCQYRNAGFSYEGEWMHGRMHGPGKLQLPDGVYEGDFRNGEITGSGMKVWSDGSQYTGEFIDGEMHGQGLFLRSDGERYEGGFVRNQRSGHGVLVMPDGTRYDGLFEEHRLNGHGTCEASNGDHYVGEWCNGNMDGMGEYWYANGDHYFGRFARNLREGKGCMFLAASGIKLDCDWECDLPVNMPVRLVAESPDRLFWKPPTPQALEQSAQEQEGDAAASAEGEEAPEPPGPPPMLKDILASPLAPGSKLPPFYVTVQGCDSRGGVSTTKRPQTPGGGIEGTTPQLGESGRLIFMTFGMFDREEPPETETDEASPPTGEEDSAEAPPPPFKRYPTSAVAIYLEPSLPDLEKTTSSGDNASADVAEAGEQLEVANASSGSPPAPVGDEGGEQGTEGEEALGEEDGAAALKTFLEQATPWPFKKVYPPPNCIGGIKTQEGRVRIEGLRLPEDIAAGTYQLRIGSSFELPWSEPVEAAYLEVTVE